VLSAERFGVPQVRKRAVLVASRCRNAGPPAPTHRGWDARRRQVAPDDLFGLRPFVTMAEALGWDDPDVVLRTPMMDRAYDASVPRTLDQPAPTLLFGHAAAQWAWERPSTTIVGSFRPEVVAAPGYRKPGDPPRQNTPGSVEVTLEQAATLQSFPDGYPWQGSKGKRFQQVGNAVPPLLAEAILGSLL
jgi:DNA (cytosine-5)-methyltransferase 1